MSNCSSSEHLTILAYKTSVYNLWSYIEEKRVALGLTCMSFGKVSSIS